jgi:hypothetical protein
LKRTGPTSRADHTQDAIVDALERVGVQVKRVGYPLDLLVNHRGRTLLIECKSPGGTFTKDQAEFMAFWTGEIHVCQTPEEAIRAVLGEEVMR